MHWHLINLVTWLECSWHILITKKHNTSAPTPNLPEPHPAGNAGSSSKNDSNGSTSGQKQKWAKDPNQLETAWNGNHKFNKQQYHNRGFNYHKGAKNHKQNKSSPQYVNNSVFAASEKLAGDNDFLRQKIRDLEDKQKSKNDKQIELDETYQQHNLILEQSLRDWRLCYRPTTFLSFNGKWLAWFICAVFSFTATFISFLLVAPLSIGFILTTFLFVWKIFQSIPRLWFYDIKDAIPYCIHEFEITTFSYDILRRVFRNDPLTDFRPDAMKMFDEKFSNLQRHDATIRAVSHRMLTHKGGIPRTFLRVPIVARDLVVSFGLYTELIQANTVSLLADAKTTWERLNTTGSRISNINVSKYLAVVGEHVVQDTIVLAGYYAKYVLANSSDDVDFLNSPAI